MSRLPTAPIGTAALAALALGACSASETQGPERPDYRGTYEGTWSVRMQSTQLESREAECPGSVTVTTQTDTSFGGTFRVEPDGDSTGGLSCREVEGEFVDGGIGSGGLASFYLRSGGSSAASAMTGCRGGDLWQGDFSLTPDLPARARFEAGIRLDLLCEEGDGPRSFRTVINFTGRQE